MIRMTLRKYFGRLKLDPLLLGPSHIVRPKQALHLQWKLDPGTWVRGKQLLVNRDVQHTAKDRSSWWTVAGVSRSSSTTPAAVLN